MPPVLNEEYRNEIKNARVELENALKNNLPASIDVLCLAYASQFAIAKAHRDHDYDAQKVKSSDQIAGPSQNIDLQRAIDVCRGIKAKITSPDLYQLAGVVAVKELGGPTIEFTPGRKESSIPPDEGCVPYDKKGPLELRKIFYPMGFNDKDIVALCGGLKLARDNAGVEGSPQPRANAGAGGSPQSANAGVGGSPQPSNAGVEGSPQPITIAGVGGSPQPANAGVGGSPQPANAGVEGSPQAQTTELPFNSVKSYFNELLNRNNLSNEIDKALVADEEFCKNVKTYAQDSQAFFADYEKSHKKLSEFKQHSWIEDHILMAQRAVGVAVAAAVAILSFFYLFKRRRASKHSSQHPQ